MGLNIIIPSADNYKIITTNRSCDAKNSGGRAEYAVKGGYERWACPGGRGYLENRTNDLAQNSGQVAHVCHDAKSGAKSNGPRKMAELFVI
jgi:hypothetical protein